MKKIVFVTCLFLCLALSINTTVFAAGNVAKIGDIGYETLDAAITAAGTNATTISLIDNINLSSKLTFPKDSNITLDLNGKTLTVPTVENNYGIVVHGNLTIKGNGTISLGMYGIGVSATGDLTIESGTYKCLTGDYLLGVWGTATIKGGLFDGNYCIANGFDNGTIEIIDGTFYSKEDTIVLGGVKILGGAFNHDVDPYLSKGIKMRLYNGMYYTGRLYKVTVEDTKNGVVKTLAEAVEEQPVKVNVEPNKGYELGQIKVVNSEGKIIGVSNGEFVMPSSDVTVIVTFESETLDNTPQTGGINILPLICMGLSLLVIGLIIIKNKVVD